jgi:hypothetical protein
MFGNSNAVNRSAEQAARDTLAVRQILKAYRRQLIAE